MPVILGKPRTTILTEQRRRRLLDQLTREIGGASTPGLLIFQIPLEGSDLMDVLVVWEHWQGIRSEDRTNLILAAYQDRKETIAQALGITYQEALEQHLLPYAVMPMTRPGDKVVLATLHEAMLAEGGITLPGDRIDLRFPTLAMAEDAHRKLTERLPSGYWSIVQSAASFCAGDSIEL